jgi:hypothetical protein
VRLGVEDLRDDDLVGVDAAHLHALDLDAGEREQVAQLLDGHVREVEVSFQPGEGDFHEYWTELTELDGII